MNSLLKRKNKTGQVISMLMVLSIMASVFCNTAFAHPKDKENCALNEVLYSDDVSVNGMRYASPKSRASKETIMNNLLGWLTAETETKGSLSIGDTSYIVDRATYVTDEVSLSGTTITIAKPLVGKGNVTISASNVIIQDTGFLLSVEGNVNIYCANIVVNGAVCADGKVFISGAKADVNEAIIADKIEIYAGTYLSDNRVDDRVLKGLQNYTAGLSMYEENGKSYLFVSANIDYSSMDIYGRKEGETSFSLILQKATNDVEIPLSWDEYVDYAAVLVNPHGYTMKTEPLSVVKQEGTLYTVSGVDSDSDGVADAYEIWLSGTNPHEKDSFPNPDYYVYLQGCDGITCYDRLLCRDVSFSTENYAKIFCYDDLNRLVSTEVCYGDGSKKQIRYEYENNRLKNLYVGKNKYTIVEDDATVLYSINGNTIKQISKSKDESTVSYFDTLNEVYRYNGKGNLVAYKNHSLYEMVYDELDLLSGVSKDGQRYESYTYDNYGNYVSIDAVDYSIHYTYDYPRYQVDYTWGDLQKTQIVNCKDDAYAYGDIVILTDGTVGQSIPKKKVGEVIDSSEKKIEYSVGEETHLITFNDRGYVIRDVWTNHGLETIIDYSYDSYGNLIQTKTTENGQETIHSYAYDAFWSDELTVFDGKQITYSGLGKPSQYYNGLEFTWAAGKLSMVKGPNLQVSYQYGINGLRNEKTVNGVSTSFIYEGSDLIAELSDDPIYYIYDGNFDLVGFEWNGQAYYYLYSVFGDVIGIVGVNGAVLCTYTYDLWGNIISIAGDMSLAERNPIRYRGYYYDNESGFYYLESRYYDPITKRFISNDDLESFFYNEEEGMESLFVYCGNNPVFYCDPDGCRKVIVQGFTLPGWKGESNRFADNLLDYAMDEMGCGEGKIQIKTYSTMSQFVSDWNSMGSIDIAFINTHGNPTCIGDGSHDYARFEYGNISSLQKKNCQLLILLGCNCGHYDYRKSNMAHAFLSKVTGYVIASDGTVNLGLLRMAPINGLIGKASFKSQMDDSFTAWVIAAGGNPNRANYGWRLYHKGYSGGISMGLKTINGSNVVSYMVSRGYLK